MQRNENEMVNGLNSAKGPCVYCNKTSVCVCERCADFYCSPECQRNDWFRHRHICFAMPYLRPQNVVRERYFSNAKLPLLTNANLSLNKGMMKDERDGKPDLHDWQVNKPMDRHSMNESREKTEKRDSPNVIRHSLDNMKDFNNTGLQNFQRNNNDQMNVAKSNFFHRNYNDQSNAIKQNMYERKDNDQGRANQRNTVGNKEKNYRQENVDNENNAGSQNFQRNNSGRNDNNQKNTGGNKENNRQEMVGGQNSVQYKEEADISGGQYFQRTNSDKQDNVRKNAGNLQKENDVQNKPKDVKDVKQTITGPPPFKIRQFDTNVKAIEVVVLDTSSLDSGLIGCINKPDAKILKQTQNYLKNYKDTNKPYEPALNEYVLAKFEDEWYRGKILRISGNRYNVFYIDFTNQAVLESCDIRRYPADLNLDCLTNYCRIDCLPSIMSQALKAFLNDAIEVGTEMLIDSVKEVCDNHVTVECKALKKILVDDGLI